MRRRRHGPVQLLQLLLVTATALAAGPENDTAPSKAPTLPPPAVTTERPRQPKPPAVASMPDMDPPVNSLQGPGKPLPANAFANGFEAGSFAGWTSLEGGRNESIALVQGPTRAGKYAARINVIPTDFAHHGNRAEVTHNLNDAPGTEGWYAWSYFIPSDYPEDADPTANWQIINQFHDQPNLDAGQSWEVFPPHNSSIALYLLNRPESQGGFAMALGFGTNLPKGTWQYGPVGITKGAWTDVLFHIGWSTGEDGFTEAWVNDQRLTPADGGIKGRTLYYDYTDYLKIGMYRNPSIPYDSTICIDELRTGPTRESVQLPPTAQATTTIGDMLPQSPPAPSAAAARPAAGKVAVNVREEEADKSKGKARAFRDRLRGRGG